LWKEEARVKKLCTTDSRTPCLRLLDGSAGRLVANIGHHDPQDPAVYAEEEDTGYPQSWRKSRFAEELEHVSLL